MSSDAGKGDQRRPSQVSYEDYANNFEHAFGKKFNWWDTPEHKAWSKESQAEKERLNDDTH